MNCVWANLGTPISRLARGKTPIGRLAFPGNIQSREKCGLAVGTIASRRKAPEGRHNCSSACVAPTGLLLFAVIFPPLKTVGYDISSLRDSRRCKFRACLRGFRFGAWLDFFAGFKLSFLFEISFFAFFFLMFFVFEIRFDPGIFPILGSPAKTNSQARWASSSKCSSVCGRSCQPVTPLPSTCIERMLGKSRRKLSWYALVVASHTPLSGKLSGLSRKMSTILFSTYTARQPNMGRVHGESAEIASRTNSCGTCLIFLALSRSLPGIGKKLRETPLETFVMAVSPSH
jgi:hypothetical protein